MWRYHVTAYVSGHDHCMETLVDGEVDYHGMGSANFNAASTEHRSYVPKGSLKFHTPRKSGGFGSYTVSRPALLARRHGTLSPPSRGPVAVVLAITAVNARAIVPPMRRC